MAEEQGAITKDMAKGTLSGYLAYSRRKVMFLLGVVALLVALCLFSIRLGDTNLSYAQIVSYLFHPNDSWDSTVIWKNRMPRIVAAIAEGAALGVAGAVMQAILRNPMASPFTLGISNAAACGAAFAILMFSGGTIVGSFNAYAVVSDEFLVPFMAFVFSLISVAVTLLLIKLIDASPMMIVLSGMALSSVFSAVLAFTQYIANETAMSSIVYWQFGSLDKLSWNNICVIIAVLVLVTVYFLYRMWDYNALEAGDEVAKGLGVNINRVRIGGLVASSLITAVVISFTGIIGFIGLIAPHMVKRLIGNDFRYLLPGSMLMGALVLLISNIIATYGFSALISTTLPVGIITSAFGGPLFLAILIAGHRRRGVGCSQ